jgi:hypothetical protein
VRFWLAASAWLTGCGPADEVDVTNTLEGVLPATESSKDWRLRVYFNALNTDQLAGNRARIRDRAQQEPRHAERQHPSQR